MLHITFSNRFETLLDALLDRIGRRPGAAFDPTDIIIPSVALKRRIELAIADRFGICANVRFSFLAQWLWRQIGEVVPVGELSPFAPPVLAWRIFAIFGDRAFVAAHPPLANYLRDADEVMRHDLALRTATLFDQYITYRADWLEAWAEERSIPFPGDPAAHADQQWQAALWRWVTSELAMSRQHPSVAFLHAMERGDGTLPARARLPAAAYVFCLPSMPPLYIDMLRGLSRFIDLELHVLNPSREYWSDIVDRRRMSALAAQGQAGHHEIGNRLLAGWGKQMQAQLTLLLEHAGDASVDDDRFVAASTPTMLGAVRNAMLDLIDLEPGSLASCAGDRSIEIHVCHSLTRELEVLQDQLLAFFAGADAAQPSDVLVVTPNLEAAAPLVDAVFRNAPGPLRIPYVITGRARSTVNLAARALLDLLAVATSRFHASAIMELLQQPIISRRFGVDGVALDAIRNWIDASSIRWGIDAAHRARFDLPPLARHTFVDGLNRLFLGYALPAAASAPLFGALPAGNAEGSEAAALGSFAHFIGDLEDLHADVARAQTSAEWMQTFARVLDTFVDARDDEIDELREVQAAISELHGNMTRGNMTGPVSIELARTALQALLDDPARGGVPTGAVTFSSMTSLRTLPYRVICVIGLDAGAWPGNTRPAEFDLMAKRTRAGDRQSRIDDRNVFLDLLLASRDQLYLSYTGRSIRDNARLPPSVLVSELIDYLLPAMATDPGNPDALAAARAQLVVEHPLQPFALACYRNDSDPRLRSFNADYCAALQARLVAPVDVAAGVPATAPAAADEDDDDTEIAQAFFRFPLAAPGVEWHDVTLDQLARFFRHPCAYLLENRLGVRLARPDDALQDDEPFVPDFPGRQALGRRLLPALLAGADRATIDALARAGPEYPAGALGALALERELDQLVAFAEGIAADTRSPLLPPLAATFDFVVDDAPWRLAGGFGDLRTTGLVRSRYDDVRARDYIDGWIAHLFLNALQPDDAACSTRWHSRDGAYALKPVADARAQLAMLLGLYARGLRAPLHFFPKSAWKFVREGMYKAGMTWRGGRNEEFSEGQQAAHRLALRGSPDPLNDEFEATANTVLGPLLVALEDPRFT